MHVHYFRDNCTETFLRVLQYTLQFSHSLWVLISFHLFFHLFALGYNLAYGS